MTPNLLVVTQKAFSPHKWFKRSNSGRTERTIEEWPTPVPGRYEHIPGRGWYLIATLKDAAAHGSDVKSSDGGPVLPVKSPMAKEYVKLDQPIQVHKSKVLTGRWFLDPDYKMRKRQGIIKNEQGKQVEVGFFQLDDGTWVNCWDHEGNFIPGDPKIRGYRRWCIDAQTKQFRHMLKRDDPNYVRSRQNSPEGELDSHSQDSMSDVLRGSRPNSTRNGPSVPSTRASSIRFGPSAPSSKAPSQRPSRANSPLRNNSIPLEEAKMALRRMAKEQEEAVSAIAASRVRTISKDRVEQIERGRPTVRVDG
ncbi:hypothetical protein IAQ61_005432 [Plenodomus lingam]|uniref:Uncharacterized protein n=1 Tax=Leptosphaeria maculans (strain JN3 / isolate v23.1.3 / race Av1-4-5-6-7-8) TaxID=985895 RepID=E4ZZB3_LEPMJ|nr:hypothetical protein LEMA_P109730.1 [Plenodomus lingam JN3]KAH9871253.1 hypothetical protein IAQ61_005432 [Plenodomus lingam]CBX96708.1 hypothetical protein LEMA_P109730.1 [Plenodomus lingam JN3]